MGDSSHVTELPEPVVHLDDARDRTGIIAKEDTAEGSESDHGDTDDIALRGRAAYSSSRDSRTTWHCRRAGHVKRGEERRGERDKVREKRRG